MNLGATLYFISFLFFMDSLSSLRHIKDFRFLGLGFLLGCYGVIALKFGLFLTGDIVNYPRMLGIEPMMHSFTTTIYFYYLLHQDGAPFKWKSWKSLIFIVPALQIILYVDYLFMDNLWHRELAQTAVSGAQPFYFPGALSQLLHMVYLGALFPVATYLFLRIFDLRKVSGPKKANVKAGFAIVIIWILFCMVLSGEYAWNAFWGIRQSPWNPLLLYGSAILFFHFWQTWPYYVKSGSVIFEARTFKLDGFYRRYLDGVDLKELEKKFKHLIEQRKIYMEENLNLPKFARELNLSVHQLSEYFNRHIQTHFLDFINKLRVEESKRLLDEEEDKTIIEICYEVGFNSSSSFYNAFKKQTGHTPKSWRNR